MLHLGQQITNAIYHFLSHESFLYLWELENDRNQPSHVLLGFQGAIIAELKTVECYVNQILVKKEMLTFIIGKDDHKGLDKTVSQVNLN